MEPNADPAGEWLGLQEAASRLGIAERTVRIWRDTGRLVGRKVLDGGSLRAQVWVGKGDPPPSSVQFCTGTHTLQAEVLPPADPAPAAALALDQYTELLRRHEAACGRIGALEEQLRDRLPLLERQVREELPRLAEGVTAAEERTASLEGRVGEVDARTAGIPGRIRGVTVALVVFALLLTAMGAMVLLPVR